MQEQLLQENSDVFYNIHNKLKAKGIQTNIRTKPIFEKICDIINKNNIIDDWVMQSYHMRVKNSLFDYLFYHSLLNSYINSAKGYTSKTQAHITYLLFNYMIISFVRNNYVDSNDYSFKSYESYCNRYRVDEQFRNFTIEENNNLKNFANIIIFIKKNNLCNKKSGKNIMLHCVTFLTQGPNSNSTTGSGINKFTRAKFNIIEKQFHMYPKKRMHSINKSYFKNKKLISKFNTENCIQPRKKKKLISKLQTSHNTLKSNFNYSLSYDIDYVADILLNIKKWAVSINDQLKNIDSLSLHERQVAANILLSMKNS